MQHLRFDVATLSLEQIPLTLAAAYLLVVRHDGSEAIEWECLAYCQDDRALPQQRYRVDLVTLDGRALGGMAALVRSVDGAHVLRGDGPLEGLGPDELG